MFNEYVWELYLKSGGKDIVEMFESNLSKIYTEEYANEITKLHKGYCPSKFIVEQTTDELVEILDKNLEIYEDESLDDGLCYLKEVICCDENLSNQQLFENFSNSISYYSTLFSILMPKIFVPYYFKYNFNVFEMIASEFGIELPPIPNKKDYLKRFYYYGEVCEALSKFRTEHNLTLYELCAFLYDFAPKYIGGIDSYIIKDLPEPKGAFFIGGSKNDIFLDEKADTITAWQCNPDTRAGDMIVMYLRSPISAVDSIWRSVSIGFNDPFFYYYRCTYIGNPTKVNRISQKQLQKDSILREMPIVRKNMQGINGPEFMPSQYNHLVDLAKAKVPKLECVVTNSTDQFLREKDVEDKLIKPLLEKLDYTEQDYVQQLVIKIGNHNHKAIPDFTLKPVKINNHQSAFAHIEAKLSIQTGKQLEEVESQAFSYARLLDVRYSVIASKEKIWISSIDDDYQKHVFVATWDEISNLDVFRKLYKILGKNR